VVPPVLGKEADMWRAVPVRRLSVAVCVSLMVVVGGVLPAVELARFRGHVGYAAGAGDGCWCS